MNNTRSTKKLFIFDLDGTILLPQTSTVHPDIVTALSRVASLGHHVVINTGRPIEDEEYVKQLQGIVKYWCLYNGNVICDSERKILKSNLFSQDEAISLLDIAFSMNLDVQLATLRGEFWMNPSEHPRHLGNSFSKPLDDVAQFFIYLKLDLNPESRLELTCQELVSKMNELFPQNNFKYISTVYNEYLTGETMGLIIISSGCTKGDSIEFLLNNTEISRDNSFMFGDADNDIPAFIQAGNAILIDSSEVKDSTHITQYVNLKLNQNDLATYLLAVASEDNYNI